MRFGLNNNKYVGNIRLMLRMGYNNYSKLLKFVISNSEILEMCEKVRKQQNSFIFFEDTMVAIVITVIVIQLHVHTTK